MEPNRWRTEKMNYRYFRKQANTEESYGMRRERREMAERGINSNNLVHVPRVDNSQRNFVHTRQLEVDIPEERRNYSIPWQGRSPFEAREACWNPTKPAEIFDHRHGSDAFSEYRRDRFSFEKEGPEAATNPTLPGYCSLARGPERTYRRSRREGGRDLEEFIPSTESRAETRRFEEMEHREERRVPFSSSDHQYRQHRRNKRERRRSPTESRFRNEPRRSYEHDDVHAPESIGKLKYDSCPVYERDPNYVPKSEEKTKWGDYEPSRKSQRTPRKIYEQIDTRTPPDSPVKDRRSERSKKYTPNYLESKCDSEKEKLIEDTTFDSDREKSIEETTYDSNEESFREQNCTPVLDEFDNKVAGLDAFKELSGVNLDANNETVLSLSKIRSASFLSLSDVSVNSLSEPTHPDSDAESVLTQRFNRDCDFDDTLIKEVAPNSDEEVKQVSLEECVTMEEMNPDFRVKNEISDEMNDDSDKEKVLSEMNEDSDQESVLTEELNPNFKRQIALSDVNPCSGIEKVESNKENVLTEVLNSDNGNVSNRVNLNSDKEDLVSESVTPHSNQESIGSSSEISGFPTLEKKIQRSKLKEIVIKVERWQKRCVTPDKLTLDDDFATACPTVYENNFFCMEDSNSVSSDDIKLHLEEDSEEEEEYASSTTTLPITKRQFDSISLSSGDVSVISEFEYTRELTCVYVKGEPSFTCKEESLPLVTTKSEIIFEEPWKGHFGFSISTELEKRLYLKLKDFQLGLQSFNLYGFVCRVIFKLLSAERSFLPSVFEILPHIVLPRTFNAITFFFYDSPIVTLVNASTKRSFPKHALNKITRKSNCSQNQVIGENAVRKTWIKSFDPRKRSVSQRASNSSKPLPKNNYTWNREIQSTSDENKTQPKQAKLITSTSVVFDTDSEIMKDNALEDLELSVGITPDVISCSKPMNRRPPASSVSRQFSLDEGELKRPPRRGANANQQKPENLLKNTTKLLNKPNTGNTREVPAKRVRSGSCDAKDKRDEPKHKKISINDMSMPRLEELTEKNDRKESKRRNSEETNVAKRQKSKMGLNSAGNAGPSNVATQLARQIEKTTNVDPRLDGLEKTTNVDPRLKGLNPLYCSRNITRLTTTSEERSNILEKETVLVDSVISATHKGFPKLIVFPPVPKPWYWLEDRGKTDAQLPSIIPETTSATNIMASIASNVEETPASNASNVVEETFATKASNVVEETSATKASNVVEETSATKASNVVEETSAINASNVVEKPLASNVSNVVEETLDSTACNVVQETLASRVINAHENNHSSSVSNSLENSIVSNVRENSNAQENISTDNFVEQIRSPFHNAERKRFSSQTPENQFLVSIENHSPGINQINSSSTNEEINLPPVNEPTKLLTSINHLQPHINTLKRRSSFVSQATNEIHPNSSTVISYLESVTSARSNFTVSMPANHTNCSESLESTLVATSAEPDSTTYTETDQTHKYGEELDSLKSLYEVQSGRLENLYSLIPIDEAEKKRKLNKIKGNQELLAEIEKRIKRKPDYWSDFLLFSYVCGEHFAEFSNMDTNPATLLKYKSIMEDIIREATAMQTTIANEEFAFKEKCIEHLPNIIDFATERRKEVESLLQRPADVKKESDDEVEFLCSVKKDPERTSGGPPRVANPLDTPLERTSVRRNSSCEKRSSAASSDSLNSKSNERKKELLFELEKKLDTAKGTERDFLLKNIEDILEKTRSTTDQNTSVLKPSLELNNENITPSVLTDAQPDMIQREIENATAMSSYVNQGTNDEGSPQCVAVTNSSVLSSISTSGQPKVVQSLNQGTNDHNISITEDFPPQTTRPCLNNSPQISTQKNSPQDSTLNTLQPVFTPNSSQQYFTLNTLQQVFTLANSRHESFTPSNSRETVVVDPTSSLQTFIPNSNQQLLISSNIVLDEHRTGALSLAPKQLHHDGGQILMNRAYEALQRIPNNRVGNLANNDIQSSSTEVSRQSKIVAPNVEVTNDGSFVSGTKPFRKSSSPNVEFAAPHVEVGNSNNSHYKERQNFQHTGTQNSQPTGTQNSQPTGTRNSQPTGTRNSQPTGTRNSQPTGTRNSQPTGTRNSQPTGTRNSQPTGTRNFQPTGTQNFQPTGTQNFQPTGTQNFQPTGTQNFQPTGTQNFQPTGTQNFQPTGTQNFQPTGTQNFQPTGTQNFQPTGTQNFQPTGTQNFQPTGTQNFQPTGTQNFQPTGTQNFQPTGTQNFQPTGIQNLQPTGTQNFQPTGTQNFQPTGTENFQHAGTENFQHTGTENFQHTGTENFQHTTTQNFQHTGTENFQHTGTQNLTNSTQNYTHSIELNYQPHGRPQSVVSNPAQSRLQPSSVMEAHNNRRYIMTTTHQGNCSTQNHVSLMRTQQFLDTQNQQHLNIGHPGSNMPSPGYLTHPTNIPVTRNTVSEDFIHRQGASSSRSPNNFNTCRSSQSVESNSLRPQHNSGQSTSTPTQVPGTSALSLTSRATVPDYNPPVPTPTPAPSPTVMRSQTPVENSSFQAQNHFQHYSGESTSAPAQVLMYALRAPIPTQTLIPMRSQTLLPMRSQTTLPMRSQTTLPMRSQTPTPMRSQTPTPMRSQTPMPCRPRVRHGLHNAQTRPHSGRPLQASQIMPPPPPPYPQGFLAWHQPQPPNA